MSEIQSLGRGLKILDLLGRTQDGISITELATDLNIDKGSASRLMGTLAQYGFAEKDEVSRRYFLGPQVVSLSRALLLRMPLREAAKPYLQQLMESSGECAHLAVHARGKALYIDQVESPATLRVNAEVGTMNPLHCTALGKVLLAFGELPLPTAFERFTPNTIVDTTNLTKNLEFIRGNGYALDDEELDIGVRCIAVPIFDFRGKLAGAMGISGPSSRLTQEKIPVIAKKVLAVGKMLSERMAFSKS